MRRVLLAFLAVILLVALCAGISLKNYADQRNRVVVQDTVPNHLVKVYYRDGLVTFREEKTLELPTGTVIEEIYLEAGEDFQVGDPLVKLEEESVLLLLYENQVAQENYNGYFYGAAEELADLKLAKLQKTESELQALLEEECVITAPENGQILEIPLKPGDFAGTGITYGCAQSGYEVTWYMKGEDYHSFANVELMLEQETLMLDANSIEKQYDPSRQMYCCSIPLSSFEYDESIGQGIYGTVYLQYVSQEYKAVLPLSAIRTDADGSNYVYVVAQRDPMYGTENYLRKTGVTIVEQNSYHAAVLAGLTDVVVVYNYPPEDLEPVLIVEESD